MGRRKAALAVEPRPVVLDVFIDEDGGIMFAPFKQSTLSVVKSVLDCDADMPSVLCG
jgi:hypothetical protein